jgi:hypothetical protein
MFLLLRIGATLGSFRGFRMGMPPEVSEKETRATLRDQILGEAPVADALYDKEVTAASKDALEKFEKTLPGKGDKFERQVLTVTQEVLIELCQRLQRFNRLAHTPNSGIAGKMQYSLHRLQHFLEWVKEKVWSHPTSVLPGPAEHQKSTIALYIGNVEKLALLFSIQKTVLAQGSGLKYQDFVHFKTEVNSLIGETARLAQTVSFWIQNYSARR